MPKAVFYQVIYVIIGLPFVFPLLIYARKNELSNDKYIKGTRDIDPAIVVPLYLYLIKFKIIVRVEYEMRQYILATIGEQLINTSCESCIELYNEIKKYYEISGRDLSNFSVFYSFAMENDEEVARKFVDGMIHYITCNNLMLKEKRIYKRQLLRHPKITSKSIVCIIASKYLN